MQKITQNAVSIQFGFVVSYLFERRWSPDSLDDQIQTLHTFLIETIATPNNLYLEGMLSCKY